MGGFYSQESANIVTKTVKQNIPDVYPVEIRSNWSIKPPVSPSPTTKIGAFFSELKGGDQVVIVGTYGIRSTESVQDEVNRINTAYPELKAKKYKRKNKQTGKAQWVIQIGDSYLLDSAQELKNWAIKEIPVKSAFVLGN